jgi:hypothetical protein
MIRFRNVPGTAPPADIALAEGKNVLRFTRNIPSCAVTITHFTVTPVK